MPATAPHAICNRENMSPPSPPPCGPSPAQLACATAAAWVPSPGTFVTQRTQLCFSTQRLPSKEASSRGRPSAGSSPAPARALRGRAPECPIVWRGAAAVAWLRTHRLAVGVLELARPPVPRKPLLHARPPAHANIQRHVGLNVSTARMLIESSAVSTCGAIAWLQKGGKGGGKASTPPRAVPGAICAARPVLALLRPASSPGGALRGAVVAIPLRLPTASLRSQQTA